MCRIISNEKSLSKSPQLSTNSLAQEFDNWFSTLNAGDDTSLLETQASTSGFVASTTGIKNISNNGFENLLFSSEKQDSNISYTPLAENLSFPCNSFEASSQMNQANAGGISGFLDSTSYSGSSLSTSPFLFPSQGWALDDINTTTMERNATFNMPTPNSFDFTKPFEEQVKNGASLDYFSEQQNQAKSKDSSISEKLIEGATKPLPPLPQIVSRKRRAPAKKSEEDLSPELAMKRQKQNEAAKKSREKKMSILQTAVERAENAEKLNFDLSVRIAVLEEEKKGWQVKEREMEEKLELLRMRVEAAERLFAQSMSK